MSEVITILVEGHKRGFTTEKQLYDFTIRELRSCFKEIPCYVQFTRSIRRAMPYLDLVIEVFTKINANKEKFLPILRQGSL